MQALDKLHRLHTIDYGSPKAGSSAAVNTDHYYPIFYLDFISIVGRPLKPITQVHGDFFDHVTISFKDWHVPYLAKPQFKMPFDLRNRTFRIATAATRETWYIVMHLIVALAVELLSRRKRLEKQAKSSRASALQTHHAQALASYIRKVFDLADFASERVEPSWTLGGPRWQTLTSQQWATFQQRFVEGWGSHVADHSYDAFWLENEPAFHAHDYGANIQIEVSEGVAILEPEARLRPEGEDEHSDEEPDSEVDSEREAEVEAEADGAGGRGRGRDADADTPFLDGDDDGPATHDPPEDALYSPGLRQLAAGLEKYNLDHISGISYALAVNLNCVDLETESPWCLLGDRNAL